MVRDVDEIFREFRCYFLLQLLGERASQITQCCRRRYDHEPIEAVTAQGKIELVRDSACQLALQFPVRIGSAFHGVTCRARGFETASRPVILNLVVGWQVDGHRHVGDRH